VTSNRELQQATLSQFEVVSSRLLPQQGRQPPRLLLRQLELISCPDLLFAEPGKRASGCVDSLARTVSDVYARSREYNDARGRNENIVQITLVLQAARNVERAAVHAYDDHIKKHGCKL